MTKVRLGIIGVGNMGSGHAANILAGKCPEIELTAVADRREARRQWAKDTLPEGTAIFVQFGLYAKFFHDMDKRLGKFWPGLVLSVVCVGVVITLVGLVGYFPVGEAPVRLPWDG